MLIQICQQRFVLIAYYHFGDEKGFAICSLRLYLSIHTNFYAFHYCSFFELAFVYSSVSGWKIEHQNIIIVRIANLHWLICRILKLKLIFQFHFPKSICFKRFFYEARSNNRLSFQLLRRSVQYYILIEGEMTNIFHIINVKLLTVSQSLKQVSIKFLFAAKVKGCCPYYSSTQHYYSANHSYNQCKDLYMKQTINIKSFVSLPKNGSTNSTTKQVPQLKQNKAIQLKHMKQTYSFNQFKVYYSREHQMMTNINGKYRERKVYLHKDRQNFLCIDYKRDRFVVDLSFSQIEIGNFKYLSNLQKNCKYLCLKEFQNEIKFIFNSETDVFYQYNLFKGHIIYLQNNFSKYIVANSMILKKYVMLMQQNKQERQTVSNLQIISHYFGYQDAVKNEAILRKCKNLYEQFNEHNLSIRNVNQYLMVQLCHSHLLRKQFEEFSCERVSNFQCNPRVAFKNIMSITKFKQFLMSSQEQTSQAVHKTVQQLKINEDTNTKLSLFDFCCYLLDDKYNYITKPDEIDESYPLNCYFCYSSHNTYLTGNQLTSKTKASRYFQDLQVGIKCVEIDIHGVGNVTHAFWKISLSNSIDFAEVIEQIYHWRRNVISNGQTHFPIILSLQNHVPRTKRSFLLKTLSHYFNNDLYYMQSQQQQFPTLLQLKGKIIVKTSTLKSQISKFQSFFSTQKLQSNYGNQFQNDQQIINNSLWLSSIQERMKNLKILDQKKRSQLNQNVKRRNRNKSKAKGYEPMLAVTGIFKSHNGIQNQDACSFSCTSLTNKKVLEKEPQKVIQYTKKSWLRTYPNKTAFRSSNYNPAEMLYLGAQMIAFNNQTKDDFNFMMHSYFSAGRKQLSPLIGYVLKPQRLLSNYKQQIPYKNLLNHLELTIVQSFGYSVSMKFIGLEKDTKDNHNKVNEFIFRNLDESFIIFNIGKYKQCVPLRFIKSGYRVLIGRNAINFKDAGIRILVKVKLRTYLKLH